MTLLAGILSRRHRQLPQSVCASLAQSISRESIDEVKSFAGPGSYLAKVDIGAFGECGVYQDSAGALSLLAGEPHLSNPETPIDADLMTPSGRLQDLIRIHEQGLRDNWDVLRAAVGTFCVVHYQPETGTLTLVADKLGIRPLYYWLDDDLVVFASALRILEECPLVPKKMDLRAVTEMVGLDYPLADRTPYTGISLLKPAEVLQVAKEKISRRSYWRWDEIEPSRQTEQARLAAVYDRFQSAVQRRIRNDRATTAYLSGGLDSRCVVASLSQSRVRLQTVNFANAGTQDYYCGNQFAEKIGSSHQSLPREDRPDFSLLMANAIERCNEKSDHRQLTLERPRLVWSGEGGSVLLGHVHLSEAIIELMRAGDVDRAIDAFLEREHIHVPPKLFRANLLENVYELIKQGIREELEQLHCADPGRNFYLFLVLNDQRRKLKSHFENIDRHRLELQLPFFDGQFVSAIMETDLDSCMRHKFYNKWLLHFPPAVTEVSWQAYPGHEPCPLPVPPELGYQWGNGGQAGRQAKEDATQKQRVLKQAKDLLSAEDFPDKILNRRNLRLAAWIHARGWRDYRYAFEAAQTYHAYSQRCGGEFILEVAET